MRQDWKNVLGIASLPEAETLQGKIAYWKSENHSKSDKDGGLRVPCCMVKATLLEVQSIHVNPCALGNRLKPRSIPAPDIMGLYKVTSRDGGAASEAVK